MEELQPGQVIESRYRLDAEIGQGGFGTVWRAVQLGVERDVAIKFLRTDLAPDARLRFEREAKALGLLNHPGCVTLHDFGVTESGQPFLVTEFVHGESLNQWRRRERSLDEILEIARQLAAALAHAHRHQLVHRDLKPANVMITRDDDGQMRVKVLDFGVARVAGDRWPDITKTGVVIGTPGFMSPEQLIGGELSPKTDLYAFGVLLFDLVEGRPPFRAETSLKLAMRHIKEDAPPMTRGPERLRDLVAQLLSRHPDDRPTSARHVHEMLQSIDASDDDRSVGRITDDAVTVKRTAPTTSFESRGFGGVRRPSIGVLALVAVGLVAVCGFVITMVQRVDHTPTRRGASGLAQVLKTKSAATDTGSGSEVPAKAPDMSTSPPDARSSSSGGCSKPFAGRGLARVSTVQGLERRGVDVFVPPDYDAEKPHPAVILMHDAFESSRDLLDRKGFGPRAEAAGAILILPRDDKLQAPWRGQGVLERARADIELAFEQLCIDRDQVFVYGNATAGTAVDQLICKLDIRAAAVSGHRFKPGEKMCRDGGVVPYLIIHQLSGFDPPDGGPDCLGERRMSIDSHNSTLVARNRCDDRRRVSEHKGSECFTWDCEVELVSCRVDGGRPWSGKGRLPCEGKPADFPYLATIWGFFFDRENMFATHETQDR